jgi:SNF2 family DNA or RNA helicase
MRKLPCPPYATLKPWQERDIRKILKLFGQAQKGVLLGTSMGLGKTGEAIVAANAWARDRSPYRVLVIAPKSALADWRTNLRRFDVNHLPVVRIKSDTIWTPVALPPRCWVTTNYETLVKQPQLRTHLWDLLIIDESQMTKERTAQRTRLIYGGDECGAVLYHNCILLSGTPLKARVEELWEQLHFLDPDRWQRWGDFVADYYRPGYEVDTFKWRVVQNDNAVPCDLLKLHRLLERWVMVRTNKEDPIVRTNKGNPLLPKQYELKLVSEIDLGLELKLGQKADAAELIGKKLAKARRDGDLITVQELQAKLDGLMAEIRHLTAVAKAQAVMDYLLTLTAKTVVIAYHKSTMFYEIIRALRRAGRGVVCHSGDNDSPEDAIDAFQNDPAVQFFVGQELTSRNSLTLTASHHVVMAEIPQVWGDFDQASDRVHRLTQEAQVLITAVALNHWAGADLSMLDKLQRQRFVVEQVLDGRTEARDWNWLSEEQI